MAKTEKSTAVTVQNPNQNALLTVDEVWVQQQELVMKLYAPDCNTNEAAVFFALGRALGADPRRGEISCAVYSKDDPKKRRMSTTLSHMFYCRRAEQEPTYDGHWALPVYEKDEMTVETVKHEDGTTTLEYSVKGRPNADRGKLIGALASCSVKGRRHPHQAFLLFESFNKGLALWEVMPEHMVTKCAAVAVLREAFAGVFGGTYSIEEMQAQGMLVNQTAQGNFGGKGMAVPELPPSGTKAIEDHQTTPEVIVSKPAAEPVKPPADKVVESTAKVVETKPAASPAAKAKAPEGPLTIEDVMKWALTEVGCPLPAFKHNTKGLTPKDAAIKIATAYKHKNPFAHME